jgi:hypothetical protein
MASAGHQAQEGRATCGTQAGDKRGCSQAALYRQPAHDQEPLLSVRVSAGYLAHRSACMRQSMLN